MGVTVQVSPEDLAFIYEELAKLRDKRKEEIRRIERILEILSRAGRGRSEK